MLVLLPPGAGRRSAVVARAPAAAAARGRAPAATRRGASAAALADSSFSARARARDRRRRRRARRRCASAAVLVAWSRSAALMVSDLAISSLRMRVGLGMDPRAELRGFAWVYLVDLLPGCPIGFLAALAARPAGARCSPLCCRSARLLAIFARERRGRIENALELQRRRAGGPRAAAVDRAATPRTASLIVDADGTMRRSPAPSSRSSARTGSRPQGAPLLDRVHPQDAALVRAFLQSVAAKPAGEPQEAEWRHALRRRHLPARRRGRHQPARRPARRAASCSPPATSRTARPSRSSCATARSTTRSPGSPTARCSTTASSTRSSRGARATAQVARAVRRPRRLQGRQRRARARRRRPRCCRRSRGG